MYLFINVCIYRWIVPYLDKKVQERAEILLFKLDKIKPIDIKYNEYDWSLNGPKPRYDPKEIHPNDLMEMENKI